MPLLARQAVSATERTFVYLWINMYIGALMRLIPCLLRI
jgi:hypothetical protein